MLLSKEIANEFLEKGHSLHFSYTYPSMEELAEQLLFVLGHFAIKSVIGFGVGAGANILARFALAHPEKVNALCLINCVSTQAGWIEWGYQKLNVRHLRSQGMTQGVLDYLMWHHFGRVRTQEHYALKFATIPDKRGSNRHYNARKENSSMGLIADVVTSDGYSQNYQKINISYSRINPFQVQYIITRNCNCDLHIFIIDILNLSL